jgi:carboxyl-terminal processing protease
MHRTRLAEWISLVLLFQGGANSAPPQSQSQSQSSNEILVRQAEQAIRKNYWASVEQLPIESFLRDRKYENKTVAYDAIRGLLSLLNDPATRFLTPEQAEALLADLRSEGTSNLGLTEVLRLDVDLRSHAITVISPIPGSPAAAAGLLPGDVVEAVDGIDTSGLALQEVTALLRRNTGENLFLHVKRRHAIFKLKLNCKMQWEPPAPASFRKIDAKDGAAGVLSVNSFTGHAAEESRAAAKKFKEWGIQALVVDLRGNPGGRLDVLASIAGLFLGESVAAKVVDKQGKERSVVKATGARILPQVPLAVLVDHGTSSAAEVLAAILKEQAGAMIVGSQTRGKTLVHNLERLPDQSGIFFTLGELITSQGTSLLNRGLEPDQRTDENAIPYRPIEHTIELLRRKP